MESMASHSASYNLIIILSPSFGIQKVLFPSFAWRISGGEGNNAKLPQQHFQGLAPLDGDGVSMADENQHLPVFLGLSCAASYTHVSTCSGYLFLLSPENKMNASQGFHLSRQHNCGESLGNRIIQRPASALHI